MNTTETKQLCDAAQRWCNCRNTYKELKEAEDRARTAREAAANAMRQAEEDLVDHGFVGEHKPVRAILVEGGVVVVRHHPNCAEALVTLCGPDGEVRS